MNEISFLVETSTGEVEVRLLRDGWTRIEPQEPGEDPIIVEEVVRTSEELSDAFGTLGLPQDEASELAEELWDELTEEERAERARQKRP